MSVKPFYWKANSLFILDQRELPSRVTYLRCTKVNHVIEAIKLMAVRGAPAIGCVAAYGYVLSFSSKKPGSISSSFLSKLSHTLQKARPTAVNLKWAVERMNRVAFEKKSNIVSLTQSLFDEAQAIEQEDLLTNQAIGRNGAKLFNSGVTVLTHCNAGSLATSGYGTALGVVRALAEQRKLKKVFVDETRPYLQGARLTAWELSQEKIPYELLTDNMAAHFMKTEKIDAVIVGCDRVAANGDTANKIGTYGLAVLARVHKIPFYVAMPLSTLDTLTKSGDQIPIEERSSDEVTQIKRIHLAPKGCTARHPAFDVTPAHLISAFITEKGVIHSPTTTSLKKLI